MADIWPAKVVPISGDGQIGIAAFSYLEIAEAPAINVSLGLMRISPLWV
jgi:hypothetical protein